MQKDALSILKENDRIFFKYVFWSEPKNYYTGHKDNRLPVCVSTQCSFIKHTIKEFVGIPLVWNSFYNKFFMDYHKRKYKLDNATALKIYRKDINGRWIVIWQNKN